MRVQIDPPLERIHKLAIALMVGAFLLGVIGTALVEIYIEKDSQKAWQARQEVRRGRR